jgi:replicative DNA helicase
LSPESLDRVSSDLVRNVPPQNLDAEQAVLGGVLLQNNIFHDIVQLLNADDFYSPAHRDIFSAFTELYRKNKPIDMLTVADELTRLEQIEDAGGQTYLAELAESVVAAASAVHYAELVKEKSVQRQLIHVSADIIRNCFHAAGDVDTLLSDSQAAIFKIAQDRETKTFSSSKDLVHDVFTQLAERADRDELVTGVPTDYYRLDEYTAGLQPSDLIIIAGRPAMGKTAFALNLAMRAAINHDVATAIFSLEMSRQQLMQRMLCVHGRIDLSHMRRGKLSDEDWDKLYDAGEAFNAAPLYIDDTPALGALELRARCRRLKAEKGLDLVVVDYLQLMRASRFIDSREQEISDISRNLKALAKELDIPVVALSQLNRKVEDRSNRRPQLADLRESGAIEQDADVIMFLYRDEAYNKDTPKKGVAEVIIGKQRNGPVGLVELTFLASSTAFENLSYAPEPSESTYTQ